MKPLIRASILALIAALLSATSQIILKFASATFEFSVEGILFNIPLIIGFGLLGVTAFLFLYALKFGELTVLYPLLATSYIWVVLASPLIFPSDSFSVVKFIGVAFIICGVTAIARGTKVSS